jgi:pimeloyl-ACP methyl ester carboxylesterase
MKKACILVMMVWLSGTLAAQNHYDLEEIPYGKNSKAGEYERVNDIRVYYEVYGSGSPLVLLHGNGGSIAGHANIILQLSKKFKVIAIDSRCHGKSGCSDELTYEMMASDVNALLDKLAIDSAFVYGHSDGGIVGLILAYTYPAKVKRLVTSGANITPDTTALEPELVAMMKNYKRIPDNMMRKHVRLMVEHPNIDFAKLGMISAPVMIVSGDRDAVLLEHSIKIFKAIPNSNFCVLPATTHFVLSEKGTMMLALLKDFFTKKFTKPSTVDWAREATKQLGLGN